MRSFFLVALLALLVSASTIFADLATGQTYSFDLVDVDGNKFSTGDGHITTIVLTTQAGIDKARVVGDRIPDMCLGNPTYRMITVLVFEKKHSKPTRMILASLMRHRLDSEGHRLQNRYNKLQIMRDARHDVSAVADFDGAIARQLGSEPGAGLFQVFVFGKNGELIKQWSDVPTDPELSSALILRHVGIDFVRPSGDSAFEIEYAGKPCIAHQPHGLRAPLAAMAMHDGEPCAIQFIQAIWQLAQWNQSSAVDIGHLVLKRLAHVDQLKIFARIELLFQFAH